jgi:hypothetical protein
VSKQGEKGKKGDTYVEMDEEREMGGREGTERGKK